MFSVKLSLHLPMLKHVSALTVFFCLSLSQVKLETQKNEAKDSVQKLKGKYELLLILGFDWNEDVWILMLIVIISVSPVALQMAKKLRGRHLTRRFGV